MFENQEMLDFAEKADNLMEEQDEVVTTHSLCIKEQGKLNKLEGKLILKATKSNNEEDEIEDYIEELELIISKRRELDDMLLDKVRILRNKMREEEEAHMNATQNFKPLRK
mmetsp:Transcript_3545/g.2992  ORF Transcript_3545/g.2992 Transcript_3545/m.2992 type:complete len:111 (-) Transcript_3545:23-355(-)